MIHCCLVTLLIAFFNVKISIYTSWNTYSVSVSILYQHTYSIFVLKQRYLVAYIGGRNESMKLKLLALKGKIITFATKGTKLNITKRWALELVSYRLAGDLSTSGMAGRYAWQPCDQLPPDTVTLNEIQWKKLLTVYLLCSPTTMSHKGGRAGNKSLQRFANIIPIILSVSFFGGGGGGVPWKKTQTWNIDTATIMSYQVFVRSYSAKGKRPSWLPRGEMMGEDLCDYCMWLRANKNEWMNVSRSLSPRSV